MHQKFMTWETWQRKRSACHHILGYQLIDYFTYLRNSAPLTFPSSRIVGSGSGKRQVLRQCLDNFLSFRFTVEQPRAYSDEKEEEKIRKKIERVEIDGRIIFCCPFSIPSVYYCALKRPTPPQFLSTENKTYQNKSNIIREVSVFFFHSVEPSEPWGIEQKFHLMAMNYIPDTFRA